MIAPARPAPPRIVAAIAAVLAHVEGMTRAEAETIVLVALSSGASGVRL